MRVLVLLSVLALMGCAAEPSIYFPSTPVREVDCDGLSISHALTGSYCEAGMEKLETSNGPLHIYRESFAVAETGRELVINRLAAAGKTYLARLSVLESLAESEMDNDGYRWGREREYGAYTYVRFLSPRLFFDLKRTRAKSGIADPTLNGLAACFAYIRHIGNRGPGAAELVYGYYCKRSATALPIQEAENIISTIRTQDYRAAN